MGGNVRLEGGGAWHGSRSVGRRSTPSRGLLEPI